MAATEGKKTSPRHNIMTRSKKVNETTTLAILKTVKSPPTPNSGTAAEDAKENKKQENEPAAPVKSSPKSSPDRGERGERSERSERDGKTGSSRYNILPRDRGNLPCAQYKTDKGYKCPNCQRCYNARKNLVRHVTLECGREPQYKCPHCAYSKHRRNELKKHLEKKHPDLLRAAANTTAAAGDK